MDDAMRRIRGSLLGMACGDAVGTTVEFMRPGTFDPVTDMTGGGPFCLQAGQWTDDTSLGLCLAESLLETGTFSALDQMRRYRRWFTQGHLSSNGSCFDIGNTTRSALARFQSHPREPYAGPTSENSAGNGSLMRLCAAPLAFWHHPQAAMELSAHSSRTTHGAPQAVDACRFFAGLLIGCMRGLSKEEILSDCYCPVDGYWATASMHAEVRAVAEGSYKRACPPTIKGTGYVVKTLEAALWAFFHTDNFKDGCLLVVNLGDDADTTAAVYGQIAGAFYGEEGIPQDWRDKCALSLLIRAMGGDLASMAEHYRAHPPPGEEAAAGQSSHPSHAAEPADAAGAEGTPSPAAYTMTDEYRLLKKAYDWLEVEYKATGGRHGSKKKDRRDAIRKSYAKLDASVQNEEMLKSFLKSMFN